MAGSYDHCVTDAGQLRDPESLAGMLENGGDVYEAVEELYGMIWWLAGAYTPQPMSPAAAVEAARQHYDSGLQVAREHAQPKR